MDSLRSIRGLLAVQSMPDHYHFKETERNAFIPSPAAAAAGFIGKTPVRHFVLHLHPLLAIGTCPLRWSVMCTRARLHLFIPPIIPSVVESHIPCG